MAKYRTRHVRRIIRTLLDVALAPQPPSCISSDVHKNPSMKCTHRMAMSTQRGMHRSTVRSPTHSATTLSNTCHPIGAQVDTVAGKNIAHECRQSGRGQVGSGTRHGRPPGWGWACRVATGRTGCQK